MFLMSQNLKLPSIPALTSPYQLSSIFSFITSCLWARKLLHTYPDLVSNNLILLSAFPQTITLSCLLIEKSFTKLLLWKLFLNLFVSKSQTPNQNFLRSWRETNSSLLLSQSLWQWKKAAFLIFWIGLEFPCENTLTLVGRVAAKSPLLTLISQTGSFLFFKMF